MENWSGVLITANELYIIESIVLTDVWFISLLSIWQDSGLSFPTLSLLFFIHVGHQWKSA